MPGPLWLDCGTHRCSLGYHPRFSPCEWGADGNLFASDVWNVFHSRQAYLHADANASLGSEAVATVPISADGSFAVMLRYEAAYRFSSPFRVTIEQNESVVFTKLFGLRTTKKLWANYNQRWGDWTQGCGPGLQAECAWFSGANENMVWEGMHDTAQLRAGVATVRLTITDAAGAALDVKVILTD